MWTNWMGKLRRLLYSTAAPHNEEYRDMLEEARSKLNDETTALREDMKGVGSDGDPMDDIIRNIRRVSEKH